MRGHEFEYIVTYYKVPAARGVRVTCDGKPGVITGAQGANVMVRFDTRKNSVPCHPTWEMRYFGNVGPQIWPAIAEGAQPAC